ncbi:MAG: hypothetical protein NZ775_01110 [Gammaproteobacteria bacterium]|nr:hypothetical protein [Gammaproteobacteria bacterium]
MLKLFFLQTLVVLSFGVHAGDDRFEYALHSYENERYSVSFSMFLELSNEGVPSASAMLIPHYNEGLGVEQNENKAMAYLGLAVTQMDNYKPEFGYQAGLMFLRIEKLSLALEQFKTAAKYKHPLAPFEIAKLKLAGLEGEVLEATMWAMIALSYETDEAETLELVVQRLLGIHRGDALQLKESWFKDNSAENLKKEMKKMSKRVKSMGLLKSIAGQ